MIPTFVTDKSEAANRRLAKLDACQRIQAYRVDDETIVCVHDGFELVPMTNGYRHDPDQIKQVREMAGTGWPR